MTISSEWKSSFNLFSDFDFVEDGQVEAGIPSQGATSDWLREFLYPFSLADIDRNQNNQKKNINISVIFRA